MIARQYSATIYATCFALGLGIIPLQPGLTVSFTPPPDNLAPRQGSGGASRGRIPSIPTAENSLPRSGSNSSFRKNNFFIPPPDNAAPTQTSGGSRDALFIPTPSDTTLDNSSGGDARSNQYGFTSDNLTGVTANMVAVTPPNFYGLTMMDRPTFMAYLPASAADQAIFRLKDQNQSIVYEQIIPLEDGAGILSVTIPENAPALEMEQYYQWFITLQTGEDMTPSNPFIDAWIKRIERTDAIAQAQVSGEALITAELLAQAGIWYDASAILAALHQDGSPETVTHWTELLTSVELGNLADAPLRFRETP